MIDYSKLVHVTDGLVDPSRKTATAPKSAPKEGSVLDRMEVRAKIVDEKKSSVKVMILDDCQITKIMTAPREEKRKILSRLTDSQRRRVLSRYREIQRIKDDESVEKLNLVNLDSLLNNCIYSSDDYNMTLLSQWKSAYEVPAEIEPFVTAVEAMDREGIESNIESYKTFCDKQGIHTQITTLENAVSNKLPEIENEGISEEPIEEDEEFAIPELNEVSEGVSDSIKRTATFDCMKFLAGGNDDVWGVADSSVLRLASKFGCDYDAVSKIYSAAWSTQFSSYQQSVTDSNNKTMAKLAARRVMDAIIDEIAEKPLLDPYTGEEVKDEEDKPILEALSEALEAYAQGNPELLDQIASTTLGGDSTEEPETEKEAELMTENAELENELEDEKSENDESLVESALEANPDEDKEDEDIEHVGDSAHPESVIGDIEKGSITHEGGNRYLAIGESGTEYRLTVGSQIGIYVRKSDGFAHAGDELALTKPEDVKRIKIAIGKSIGDSSPIETQCPFEKIDEDIKEEEKIDKELAKELAKLLKDISEGKVEEVKDSLNGLVDKLAPKVPALRKYNFKVSDCAPVMCPCEAPASTINPPLSRSEYYDMCPVCPDYFDLVVAQYSNQLCPSCNEYQVNQNGLCVNPSTCPQTYYPYNCTLQEIADLLQAAEPKDYTGIVNAHCCPMSDALHIAALTNNLGFIDNTFYRNRIGSKDWVFDSVPECLKPYTDKPGKIRLIAGKTIDSANTVNLFGVMYELL